MRVDIPETVACPCGTGYAERLDEPTREPATAEKNRYPGTRSRHQQTTYTYRHAGCHIGGHIVVDGGRVVRRGGPLFNPGRFGIETADGAAAGRRVATDGGEPR